MRANQSGAALAGNQGATDIDNRECLDYTPSRHDLATLDLAAEIHQLDQPDLWAMAVDLRSLAPRWWLAGRRYRLVLDELRRRLGAS